MLRRRRAASLGLLVAAGVLALRPAPADAQPGSPPPPPEEVIRLPEVKVLAPARLPTDPLPLSSVPASIQVVLGEEIRQSGAVTLQDYLTRLPGVTLSDQQGNSFQPSIFVRGFEGSSVTGVPQGISVFVDGVRVNEPAVEEINFDLLPLEDVERIEIIRGPSAVFGRNTLAGAVNIVTRRGSEVRDIGADVGGGSFGRQRYRVHAGGALKPFDYYFSGTLFREDGWRDESSSEINRFFGKVGYKDERTDVTLSYQHAQNRIEQAGSLPESELRHDRRANFTGGDFFKPTADLLTLNLRQQLGENVALLLNGFGRWLDSEQFNVSLAAENTRLFTDTTSFGGAVQLNYDAVVAGRKNRLVLGAEYVHNDVAVKIFDEKNDRSLAACITAATAAGEDPAAACPLKSLNSRLEDVQHAVGIYIQDTFELAANALRRGDSLVLTGAVRWDWLRHDIDDRSPPEANRASAAGVSTFSRVNPRVGLNYNLSPDVGIYFTYSQGFRAPAFLELTCAGPAAACPGLQAGVAQDPPLKSVTTTSYELGVRAQPVPWLSAELSIFRTDVANDIFSVAPTGTTTIFFQNIGDTRRQGIEVGLRGSAGRRLDAYVNYTYTEATFQDEAVLFTPRLTPGCVAPPCTEVVRKGSDFPLIPHHRLNAGVDYHLTRWLTLSLTGAYVGAQWLRGDEENVETKLKDYAVLNAGLKARWRQLEGFLWVNNVLDNHYETFGTFAPNPKVAGSPVERFLTPAPPINVVVGVSARF